MAQSKPITNWLARNVSGRAHSTSSPGCPLQTMRSWLSKMLARSSCTLQQRATRVVSTNTGPATQANHSTWASTRNLPTTRVEAHVQMHKPGADQRSTWPPLHSLYRPRLSTLSQAGTCELRIHLHTMHATCRRESRCCEPLMILMTAVRCTLSRGSNRPSSGILLRTCGSEAARRLATSHFVQM